MTEPLLITEFLHRARDLFGDTEIVQYQHGSETFCYTYGDYYDRVVRLAGALVQQGVRPGDRVATLAWNHYRHLELYLAVPLAGAVLHTLNLRLSADELAYIVHHADDRMVAADPDLLNLLGQARQQRPEMPVVCMDSAGGGAETGVAGQQVIDYERLLASGESLEEPPLRDENALAALCYTSGTTGAPKGVGYSHRSLYLHTFAACLADGHAIGERDTVLHVVPMFHANAWGVPFAALMSGAKQILPGSHPSAPEIAGMIEQESVSYTGMVPTVAVDLVRHATGTGADLSSLRALVLGGSPPSIELVRSIEEELGVPAFQGWGMTEISPMGTFSRPPAGENDPQERHEYVRKQGRLLPGLRWRLVDDAGNDLPHDGVARGELLLRGPWVANRYYRDEHPDSFFDGWLRTGDVATIDSKGFLEVVDRAKDLIKSGGEWISSVALEQALLANPSVRDAAVIAIPHERWQERPLAVVVLSDPALPEQVLTALEGRVPRWWRPERLEVVEEIPRTSVGKIDKKRLRETVT